MRRINKSLLIKITKKSHHKTFNHATLIVKSGRILAQGYNHKFIHSEQNAIEKAFKLGKEYYIEGSTFINLMIRRKTGSFGNSRPCKNCMEQMIEWKVRRVLYYDGTKFVEERVS